MRKGVQVREFKLARQRRVVLLLCLILSSGGVLLAVIRRPKFTWLLVEVAAGKVLLFQRLLV